MENSKEPGKKKINDEDLGTVSGGCGSRKPDPHKNRHKITFMECRECDYVIWYRGLWNDGKYYKCPNCGKMALIGRTTKDKEWY